MTRIGVIFLGLAMPAMAAAPVAIGQYAGWGAFRAEGPSRCYAIAQPQGQGRHPDGYATIAGWPARGLARRFHARLSRGEAKQAVLHVGDLRLPLRIAGSDVWLADPAIGPRLIRALRDSETMRIEAITSSGRRFSDTYALAGAPSAIDAADLACAR